VAVYQKAAAWRANWGPVGLKGRECHTNHRLGASAFEWPYLNVSASASRILSLKSRARLSVRKILLRSKTRDLSFEYLRRRGF
jgi:hypothetical protein